MPKPTAIQLTKNNIRLISSELDLDEEKVAQEYVDCVIRPDGGEPAYYVKDPYLFTAQIPYLLYGRSEFLDDFASVPPGIEDRFVPVTQVKKD